MRIVSGLAAACTVVVLLAAPMAKADRALPPGISAEAIKSATTPEQHRAIADAYTKEAEDLRAKALAHRYVDSTYNDPRFRFPRKLGLARYCRARIQTYEAAAKEADGLATGHRAMADEAAKKSK